MTKYEYIRLFLDFGDLEPLNALGSTGWKVASVVKSELYCSDGYLDRPPIHRPTRKAAAMSMHEYSTSMWLVHIVIGCVFMLVFALVTRILVSMHDGGEVLEHLLGILSAMLGLAVWTVVCLRIWP